MQTRRRLFAVLAATATAAALVAGCSSSDSSSSESAELPDAATLLTQSSEATKAVKSVHLELKVDGTIEGLPIKVLAGDLTNEPVIAAQGDATISMGGSDIEADFVVADSNLFVALSPDSWLDLGPAVDVYDVSLILNPDAGLANILANFTEAKADGTESINGVETVKVTGSASADAVNKLVPNISATGPVPATAWIQKDEPHNLVQANLAPSPGNSITMTLSDWGKSVSVTKPAV